jgi:hypothetical protein
MDEKSTENVNMPAASSSDSAATEAGRHEPEPKGKAGEMERDIHGVRWFMTVCAILSCVFLFALDTTVVC